MASVAASELGGGGGSGRSCWDGAGRSRGGSGSWMKLGS